jgi:WD40 repeat protein
MDRNVRIWDAASGREIVALEGHVGTITASHYSLDGQRLVTTSEDHTVKVRNKRK